MAKPVNTKSTQLSLELPQRRQAVESVPKTQVSTFVDAGTLKVRRHAAERVISSGIFSAPKSSPKR